MSAEPQASLRRDDGLWGPSPSGPTYPSGPVPQPPRDRFKAGEWATVLYFGRWTPGGKPHDRDQGGTPGHQFRAPRGQYVPNALGYGSGWSGFLDAGFKQAHQIPRKQGAGLFLHFAGCSVLDWWDDSSGTQPGCSSAFVVTEIMPLEEVLTLAAQAFPEILKRQPGPIYVDSKAVWKPRRRA